MKGAEEALKAYREHDIKKERLDDGKTDHALIIKFAE